MSDTHVVSRTMVRLVGSLALTLLVAAPRPAEAWFGWLDQFSGPGEWVGSVGLESRLYCMGRKDDTQRGGVRRALDATRAVATSKSQDPRELSTLLRSAQALWSQLDPLPVTTPSPATPPPAPAADLSPRSASIGSPRLSPLINVPLRPFRSAPEPADPAAIARVKEQARIVVDSADTELRLVELMADTGVFWSRCDTTKIRLLSLDLATDVWWTGGDSAFADGKAITLVTVAPALSLRLIPFPAWDIADAGLAVGRYQYFSRGFASFGGLMVQPYIGLHAPTAWLRSRQGTLKRGLAALTLRISNMYLPAGLDAVALGAADRSTPRLRDRNGVPSVAVFINLRALKRPD